MGVANKRSIAWAIAKRLHDEGAELAFTFQGERIEKGVRELADSVGAKLVTECDVRSDDDVARVFRETGEAFGGGLDLLVHSVAFAAAEDLEGRFIDTPRDRFWMAVDVSAYSLVSCAKAAEPLMQAAPGGLDRDDDVPGRRPCSPALQRDGCCEGDPRREHALPRVGPGAERHPRQRRSRPGRCVPLRPARSPGSRRWRRCSSSVPRSIATSQPTTSEARPPTCFGRCRQRDRNDAVRRLAAITQWACDTAMPATSRSSLMRPTPERGDTSVQIALEIRRYLARTGLGPGDRLGTEQELAKEFGVSRPTLREALRLLASSHLIRASAGRAAESSSRARRTRGSAAVSATRSRR